MVCDWLQDALKLCELSCENVWNCLGSQLFDIIWNWVRNELKLLEVACKLVWHGLQFSVEWPGMVWNGLQNGVKMLEIVWTGDVEWFEMCFSYDFKRFEMAMPWHGHGVSMALPWHVHGMAMTLVDIVLQTKIWIMGERLTPNSWGQADALLRRTSTKAEMSVSQEIYFWGERWQKQRVKHRTHTHTKKSVLLGMIGVTMAHNGLIVSQDEVTSPRTHASGVPYDI